MNEIKHAAFQILLNNFRFDKMHSKIIILIISSLLAIVKSQCPSYWWPLTSGTGSVGFLSEVMKGDNINGISGPQTEEAFYLGTNRIGNAAGYRIITTAVTNAFVLPPDYYFCNGAFSVTFWILQPIAAVATVADFKDINGNGVIIALTSTGLPTLGINTIKAVAGTNAIGTTWSFVAITFSGTGTRPVFYTTSASPIPSTLTTATGTVINGQPSCSLMLRSALSSTRAIPAAAASAAGLVGSLNDFKIYNFALNQVQATARLVAEKCKLK